MFGKPRHVAVSFHGSLARIAEVEHGKSPLVTALGETPVSINIAREHASLNGSHDSIATVAEELRLLFKVSKLSPGKLSFVLPTDAVFVNRVPADVTLPKADLKEQVAWEVSQFFSKETAGDMVTSLLAATAPSEGVAQAYIVGIRKGLIAYITQICAEMAMKRQKVDVAAFTIEKTVQRNFPELADRKAAAVEVSDGLFHFSILTNGEASNVHSFSGSTEPELKQAVREYFRMSKEEADGSAPAAVLFYGDPVTPDTCKTLGKETGAQVVPLNPFRRLAVARRVRKEYEAAGPGYAAAIGLALREP